jgi:hypothetical protein
MNNLSYICMGLVVLFNLNVANAIPLDASGPESKASTNDFLSILVDYLVTGTNTTAVPQSTTVTFSNGSNFGFALDDFESQSFGIVGPPGMTIVDNSNPLIAVSLSSFGNVPESGSLLPILCALLGLMLTLHWLKSKSEPRPVNIVTRR